MNSLRLEAQAGTFYVCIRQVSGSDLSALGFNDLPDPSRWMPAKSVQYINHCYPVTWSCTWSAEVSERNLLTNVQTDTTVAASCLFRGTLVQQSWNRNVLRAGVGTQQFRWSFCQVKMWKGRMMTWNAVLDCQRLTGSDFSDITAIETQIEAAAKWHRARPHFTAFQTTSLLAGMQLPT